MKLSKDCLIEKICSKDATRPALAAPYLDIDAERFAHVIATNGAAMAKIPVEIGQEDTQGHIPVEGLKAARKATRGKGAEIDAKANGSFALSTGQSFPREVDATFPNWRQVWPKAEGKIKLSFDARLLYDLAQAMGTEGVILTFDADGIPIAVSPALTKSCTPSSLGARGVIMPLRMA